MPVIFLDRQPPPFTTARQASDSLLKFRWQNTVNPPGPAALSPSSPHGRPGTVPPLAGAVVVCGVFGAVVGVLVLVVLVLVEVVRVLEVVVATGTELVVALIELEVGGATVTVVKTMAGRVGVGRAVVGRLVVGRVGTGLFGVIGRLVSVERVASADGGEVVVPDAGDDDAACRTEISIGAVSLTSAELLSSGDVAAELLVGAADCSRAL